MDPRTPTMPPDRRRRRLLAGLALAGAGRAWAQGEGAPLRLVVPFTPGTGIDLVARTLAPRLAERLGRPVIVDNRSGASGNIGTEAVVRAAPDGTTLLVTVSTLVMNRALFADLPWDPLRDLVPVSMTSRGELVLVAGKASGIDSVAALLRAARARPGQLNYGSPGHGTPHHLAMEQIKIRGGLFITHIPYRGSGPALADLIGGQIDLMFLPVHVALGPIRAGRLTALGIGSPQPHPLLPGVLPLRQLGLGGIEVDIWYGVLAPRGTPEPVVARLATELSAILALPEVHRAFATQGMTPQHRGPEDFGRLIKADAERWQRVIRTQGIRAE